MGGALWWAAVLLRKVLTPNLREIFGQAGCAVRANIVRGQKRDTLLDCSEVNDEFTEKESCLCSVLWGN